MHNHSCLKEKSESSKYGKKIYIVFFVIACAVLSIFLYLLFYKYITGIYYSDYPLHIDTIKNGKDGYSMMHKIIGICLKFPVGVQMFICSYGCYYCHYCLGNIQIH